MIRPARAAAIAAAAVVLAAGAIVTARVTNTAATAPDAPTLVGLKRPVPMRWTKVPGATAYLITRNGVVVRTVTAATGPATTQTATVPIPCTGSTISTLRVVARNASGKSKPSNGKTWGC